MSYVGRAKSTVTTGGRVSLAEAEGRRRLRAELEAEMRRPLTPGVTLSLRERAAIAERVHTGRIAQSFYAKGGGGHSKAEE